ncbi:OHCU decarboxylase [Enterobacterales bacterium]|nr:OHCU decarboxylase [Enterobacterales bacterium]
MTLNEFNALSKYDAVALLRPLVNIPAWATMVCAARPFYSLEQAIRVAENAAQLWQPEDIQRALAMHPRIGERAAGASKEAQLSRGEQATLNIAHQQSIDALQQGNLAYEQRFGQVFLIRAKGRSTQEILENLQRRLLNSPQTEQGETAEQLRQITLLRFKECFTHD